MADLKSCPFCGGEASARKTYKGTFAVSCNRLCVGQYGYDTEQEAIEAWNTRKPMEAVVAKLKKETVIGADCIGNGFECIPKFKAIEIVRNGGKE